MKTSSLIDCNQHLCPPFPRSTPPPLLASGEKNWQTLQRSNRTFMEALQLGTDTISGILRNSHFLLCF